MSDDTPTPAELREILVKILTGAAGGTEAEWRAAVGEVEKLSLATHVRSNWAVAPKGDPMKLETIERAVEVVRAAHPYVTGE